MERKKDSVILLSILIGLIGLLIGCTKIKTLPPVDSPPTLEGGSATENISPTGNGVPSGNASPTENIVPSGNIIPSENTSITPCTETSPSQETLYDLKIRNCTQAQLVSVNISDYSYNTLMIINTTGTAINSALNTGTLPEKVYMGQSFLKSEIETPQLKSDTVPLLSKTLYSRLNALKSISFSTTLDTNRNFVVLNFAVTNGTRTVSATKVAENSRVAIYVENTYVNLGLYNLNTRAWEGGNWNFDLGTNVATAFSSIYTSAESSIGTHNDRDSNGKIIILFHNLEYPNTNFSSITGIIAGYFYYPDLDGSLYAPLNENTDILYMNVLTLKVNASLSSSFSNLLTAHTMAHEYQHIVNYSSRRLTSPQKPAPDTWLNESMSELFSDHAMGSLTNQVNHMKTQADIQNGLGLFYWESSALQYTIGYNFLTYATLQTPLKTKAQILQELINSNYGDYRALQSVFINGNTNFANFKDLYAKFHLATLLNKGNSIYGFRASSSIFNYTGILKTTLTSANLKPGGRLFKDTTRSALENFTLPSNAPDHLLYVKIRN